MAVVDRVVEWAVAYSDELARALRFFVTMAIVYVLASVLVEPTVDRVVRRSNPDNRTLQRAVTRHFRLGMVIVAVAAGLTAAGYARVLTGSNLVIAAATLAIGVAGQEIIGSIISGVFLVANPDFSVGDWIQWDDTEGEIESIHFRTTRVRTASNEIVTVPNTELTENTVVHRFGRDRLRLTQDVGVAYETDVAEAIDRLAEIAAGTDAVLESPRPRAHLLELGDDEVRLRLEYWVADPSRHLLVQVRSALALAIKDAFETADLELSPAPERDLRGHVRVSIDDDEADGREEG